MYINDLPGRIVHVKMGQEAFEVMFEKIPWLFSIAEVSDGLQAFNINDWEYFHKRFWETHQHLKTRSRVLKKLAALLDGETLYAPNTIMEMAMRHNIYGSDQSQVTRDLQRLLILPTMNQWPPNGFGLIQHRGQIPVAGWPGSLWIDAILTCENEKPLAWEQSDQSAFNQASKVAVSQ